MKLFTSFTIFNITVKLSMLLLKLTLIMTIFQLCYLKGDKFKWMYQFDTWVNTAQIGLILPVFLKRKLFPRLHKSHCRPYPTYHPKYNKYNCTWNWRRLCKLEYSLPMYMMIFANPVSEEWQRACGKEWQREWQTSGGI